MATIAFVLFKQLAPHHNLSRDPPIRKQMCETDIRTNVSFQKRGLQFNSAEEFYEGGTHEQMLIGCVHSLCRGFFIPIRKQEST